MVDFVISIIVIYTFVSLGYVLEHRWNLADLYVSPPLAGGIIGVLINLAAFWITGFSWEPQRDMPAFLLALFLFSIGVRIAFVYSKRHLIHLLYLLLFGAGSILIMETLAWAALPKQSLLLYLFGSSSAAWNPAWIQQIKPYLTLNTDTETYLYYSLLLVFVSTPLVLRWMSRFEAVKINTSQLISVKQWDPKAVVAMLISAGAALWVKHAWLQDALFLFDFVIAMGFGILVGLFMRNYKKEINGAYGKTCSELGTLSLYGFIVSMLLVSADVVFKNWSWLMLGWQLIKIGLITAIYVWISRKWVKNHRGLVLSSACWAFTLSAPVACMNAMRTVVGRHGTADDVLLLVPPVILWLINYPHYLIIALFYR